MRLVFECLPKPVKRTHGYCNAEQAAYYSVYIQIDIVVARLCTVHRPVCVVSHTQTEQVGFGDDEIEILIEHLADAFGCSGLCCLSGEFFKQWS